MRAADAELIEMDGPNVQTIGTDQAPESVALGVFGLSYRSNALQRLTGLRIPDADRAETLAAIQREMGFAELVYLSTCNRVEFIYSSTTPVLSSLDPRVPKFLTLLALPAEAAAELHYRGGVDAVRYVFEIASALDSMVVGEAQILGQLKRAYEEALREGRVAHSLSTLCEGAFRVAKEVRSETGLATHKLSLVSLVADEVRRHLAGLESPTIALLGAGEMIAKVAGLVGDLVQSGKARALFVNRTPEHAEALAQGIGGEVCVLRDFLAAPPAVDLFVTATSAGEALVGRREIEAMLPSSGAAGADRRLLVIDLAMPGDVTRDAGAVERVDLIGIEHLRERAERNHQARQAEAERARPIVDQAVARFRDLDRERALTRVASRLQPVLESTVEPQPGAWPELLIQRAHKVVMSRLRQGGDKLWEGLVTDLSSPANLDRKSFRAMPLQERAALEVWCRTQAERISASASALLSSVG